MLIPLHVSVFAVSSGSHERARIPRRTDKPSLAATSMHCSCKSMSIPLNLAERDLAYQKLGASRQTYMSKRSGYCAQALLALRTSRCVRISCWNWRSSLTPDRQIRHPSVIVRAVLRPVTQQPQKAQLSHLPWRNWLARSTVRFVFWHISYREVDSSSLSGRAYLLLDCRLMPACLYLGFGFSCGMVFPTQAQRLHSPPRCSLLDGCTIILLQFYERR